MSACAVCAAAAEGVDLDGDWFVAIAGGRAPLDGWISLAPLAHRVTLADLSDREASTLGHHLRSLSSAIVAITGAARTYAANWAEATQHVHVHLVPRHDDLDAALLGYRIFGLMDADHQRPDRDIQRRTLERIAATASARSAP